MLSEKQETPRRLTPDMLAKVGRENLIKKMSTLGALREPPEGRERLRDPQTKAVLPWSGIKGEVVQAAVAEYLNSKSPDRMLTVASEKALSKSAGSTTEGMMHGADVFIFVLDKLGMEIPKGLKDLKAQEEKAAREAQTGKTARAA